MSDFSPPPGGSRGSDPDEEEAGTAGFAEPSAESAEPASFTAAADALSGVPSNLLEVKASLEAVLESRVASGQGVQAAAVHQGEGNIQGVAVGVGDEASVIGAPGAAVLVVFVAEPTSTENIRSVVSSTAGVSAAALDEVPVQVVRTGVIDAQSHRFRLRAAAGGISAGHYKITAGTIGCLSFGRSAPRNSRLMILSNNHVLANTNGGVYGDCVCQPGSLDGGRCPADQVAILERYTPISFSGSANYVDCATAWAWPDRVRRDLAYLDGGGRLNYFRVSSGPIHPAVGMYVGKTGRTTQLRQGRITAVGATVNVNYGNGRVALFKNQFAVRAASGDFSQGGDSGSLIWRWDSARNPVGLLFAGGGGTTFANPINYVLNALDIHLYT